MEDGAKRGEFIAKSQAAQCALLVQPPGLQNSEACVDVSVCSEVHVFSCIHEGYMGIYGI